MSPCRISRRVLVALTVIAFAACGSPPVTVDDTPGGGSVTVVAAAIPGADMDAVAVTGPLGARATWEAASGRLSFDADGAEPGRVAVMDVTREFGWSATYPYWFTDVDVDAAASRRTSTLSSSEKVGPLSTAVDLVLLTPNVSTRDTEFLPQVIDVLRHVPEVEALAAFLLEHGAAADPLAVDGFRAAYEAAIDAAVDALDEAGVGVSAAQRAAVVPIDQAFTTVSEAAGLVSVGWDDSVWPINRTVTHLGVIYEIDTTAYASEHALRIELLNIGPDVAPVLLANAPVARISLPAEDPAAVIDVIGLAIGVVFDAVFGLFGPDDLPAANEQSLPEGAYMVHLQGCAVMTSPLALLHPDMGNYGRDLEIILGWPGTSSIGNAVNACALFTFENAVDTVSLLVNISDVVSGSDLLDEPWPDLWGTAADVLVDTITGTTDAAWSSLQMAGITTVFTQALLETVAKKAANEGLKALLQMKARALTSLVDLPGKLSSAASLTARSVTAQGITPLEASLVIVGNPWSEGTVEVAITPETATLSTGADRTFSATVTGASDTTGGWSATCGTVTGAGTTITYTAPSTVPPEGTCTLTVTSHEAPTATATALVTVIEAPNGPGATTWTRQFGTVSADHGRGVATDASRNVIVAGFTLGSLEGTSAGFFDGFVRKYDPDGTHLWTQQFGTAADEYVRGVATDADGNVIVTGETYGSLAGTNAGSGDAFVRKYDPDGTHLWTQQFGTTNSDYANAVATDADGHIIVTGETYGSLAGTNAGSGDAFVRKYDPDGTHLWTQQFGTTGRDYATGVTTDAVGRVFVAGATSGSLNGPAALGDAAFVRAYDASGDELWTQQYTSGVSQGTLGVAAGAGAIAIAGFVQTEIGAPSSVFVSSYDTAGNPAWTRQFGTSVNDFARGVAIDGAGDVIVVGDTAGSLEGTSAGGIDAFVRRYTSVGTEVSTRQFGSAGDDYGMGVALDGAGAIIVAGETSGALEGTSAGGLDAFVRRLAP